MRFLFIRANYFEGDEQPVEDTPINGTLEGDCTGIINFPFLGGIQPYAYYPENCSVVMSTTGNVFQNRNDRCPGNFFSIEIISSYTEQKHFSKSRDKFIIKKYEAVTSNLVCIRIRN